MNNSSSTQSRIHQILAILCVGIFVGAMALNSLPVGETKADLLDNIPWATFQYGLPLFMGAVCLTGKRWGVMAAVLYATIGLALDLATLVQSITADLDSTEFIVVVLTTGLLNFSLIVFGGIFLLKPISLKTSSVS